MNSKIRLIKGVRMLFALVLATAFTALSAVGPAQLALADAGGVKGHTFDVTFTIWPTSLPATPPSFAGVTFAGVVGGAVGSGRFAGETLNDNLTVPGFWIANSRYEFYGEGHSLIADVHLTQDTTTGITVITGVVTQGWLGARN
jgi:hypothetical protein